MFLEHKRDIEYYRIEGEQITDVAGRENQILWRWESRYDVPNTLAEAAELLT